MPTIDATQGVLVIRIVYDGPAMSGKTSSLKSLASSVQSRLESREERDGRTLYFDWMEYVGGLFEGRQIRCQIVSVPGQVELAARRRRLLEEADAVVCVLDTRRGELDYGLSWLAELVPSCRAGNPPVGVVLQANKRDTKDAAPREELRARVSSIAPIAIVESVATTSDGIREAFVLAVRLALDRVRALASAGLLSHDGPLTKNSDALFASLQDSAPQPVATTYPSRPPSDRPTVPLDPVAEQPFVPDPMMPSGTIWPPVDGRVLLHEVARLGITTVRTARGDWWGSVPGWRFHSSLHALYPDADRGREALIAWARMHAAQASILSTGRAVVLAEAGAGRTRLWQLINVVPTLREQLDDALETPDPAVVAAGILEAAERLEQARESFVHSGLACTLWSVGYVDARVCFAGLMPMPGEAHDEEDSADLLAHELTPHLRRLRRTRVDYSRVMRDLAARAELVAPDSVARRLVALARTLD